LVGLQELTYTSGLTKSEQSIIQAQTTVRINTLTATQFKMSMVKPITISGIKQLPSQEEFTILSQLIVEKYGNITLGEMQLAFDLNALGTEWTRIEHYNMFSIQYVSDVLSNYIEYSRKMMQEVSKKAVRKELPASERANIQALHDMLMADKQDANYKKKVRYTAPLIMQSLIKRQYFKDEYINDEWLKEVRINVKGRMFQIMGEWDRAKYSSEEWRNLIKTESINQVKCEVYKHIIDNDELFNTIMNNIKADL
jgi:hypothetical protein